MEASRQSSTAIQLLRNDSAWSNFSRSSINLRDIHNGFHGFHACPVLTAKPQNWSKVQGFWHPELRVKPSFYKSWTALCIETPLIGIFTQIHLCVCDHVCNIYICIYYTYIYIYTLHDSIYHCILLLYLYILLYIFWLCTSLEPTHTWMQHIFGTTSAHYLDVRPGKWFITMRLIQLPTKYPKWTSGIKWSHS